ncbi:hypothetical protein THRCLA_11635 [Thraustotheca clavata]|uniref:DUF4097 domain-containing protein n=1 Tax=Thraustotheca clavata TaxID=74557 RepID=A0A1V9Y740_9STRA|nr:hypothetical protein THRCLA_11635 [Thraustotheca clavata]
MRNTTLPRISTTTPGVQRACMINFIFSLVGAPMCFVFAQRSQAFHTLYAISGAMCVLGVFGSGVGWIKATPALVWCMLFAIGVCYGTICTGGLCFLFLPYVTGELASYTDKLYAQSVLLQQTLANKVNQERVYLIVGGVILLIVGAATAYLIRKLHRALGEKRSAATFLQAFSIGMIPFSFILVAGGQYIITSQTLASAPYTGIFTFLCGILVFVLALMAFIGSAFEYRRLLNTFSWFSFILGIMLLAGAIACFVISSNVEQSIADNWTVIRVVLPPTLQARYDKAQFVLFVQRNLEAVSFVAIVSGAFMLIQSLSAITLNDITHVVKRRHAQDKHCQLDPKLHPEFAARRDWNILFKASRRTQRICMRLSCAFALIAFLAISVLMTLSVVFSTQCTRISKAQSTTTAPFFSGMSVLSLAHKFQSGSLSIVQNNDTVGSVLFQQNAISNKFLSNSAYIQKQTKNTSSFTAIPTTSSYFFWVDTSCQMAVLELQLPNASYAPMLELSSQDAAIDINLLTVSESVSSILIRGINVSSDKANVDCFGAYLGSGGLTIISNSGDINVDTIYINGTGDAGFKGRTTLTSTLGGVTLSNTSLTDSPLFIETDASSIFVQNVVTQVTHGYSVMETKTMSGAITLSDVTVDFISMQTQSGTITTDSLTANGEGVFFGRVEATSYGGEIQMLNTVVQGSIHIETNSGDVFVHLESTTFVGFYYIRSDYGSIGVHKGNYSYDTLSVLPSINDQESMGYINCAGNCNFQSNIYIRSTYGNIHLVLGCENAYLFDIVSIETKEMELTECLIKRRSNHFDIACVVRLNLAKTNLNKVSILNECTSLLELNLSHNQLTSAREVPTLPNLKILDLSHNGLNLIGICIILHVLKHSTDNLPSLVGLEELRLEGNDITTIDFTVLKRKLPQLRRLTLRTTKTIKKNQVCDTTDYFAIVKNAFPTLEFLDGEALALCNIGVPEGLRSKQEDHELNNIEMEVEEAAWERFDLSIEPRDTSSLSKMKKSFDALLLECKNILNGESLELLNQMEHVLDED